MAKKTSIINKNTLDRLSEIFPNVVWKDYTNHYGKDLDIEIRQKYKKQSSQDKVGYFDRNNDRAFHIILKEIVDSAPNNDFDIISEFYNYKHSHYLLPPKDNFNSVAQSIPTNDITLCGGIYIFFNEYFTEKKFESNLSADLQVNLKNGEKFPLNKAFNKEMKEWLCYYNDKNRFQWDRKEKINFGHNPNVPWEAFQNHCQYAYTLVKIGYEKRDSSKPIYDKSTYKEEGFKFIRKDFKLEKKKDYYNSRLRQSVDYEKSDYCILEGNINIGIETILVKEKPTKNHNKNAKKENKDIFLIKNFEQTKTAICKAIRYRKYENEKIFDFTDSDVVSINRIYEENSSQLNLPEISKKDFELRFKELNKNRSLLNGTYRKRIEEIAEKIAIKNPIPQSKTKNEIENEYDCTDEVAYRQWEDEKNKLDKQSQLKELAECFCAEFPNDEKEFKDCIKQLIGKPDGIKTFAEGLNDLECKDKASESVLVIMYSRLYKSADITLIVKWLKGKKEHALKKYKEI